MDGTNLGRDLAGIPAFAFRIMNRIFKPFETRPAGSVFPIPSSARHVRDNKRIRPFLLLTRVTGAERGTLALMTTKSTETIYGAPLYELVDQRGKLLLPGQERSYVNLSSLIFRRADSLLLSDQAHSKHLPAIRAQLKAALGIGSGAGPGGPHRSIRGHLVRMSADIAERYDFEFAVVLTNHQYSAARRLQILVPVMDVRAFLAPGETAAEFEPEDGDVLPAPTSEWVRQLPHDWELPVIDTVRLASFTERWQASPRRETWLEEQIVAVYPVPLDPASLARVEAALVDRLALPA